MALKVPVARPDKVGIGSPVSAQQNINAPAEAFGGGAALNGFKTGEALGKAAQNIGADIVNYAALAREQEDKAIVNDRLAQAKDYLNSVLYDPESGLMTKQNKDAMGAGKVFAERARQAREKFGDSMTERQRRLFDEQFRTTEAAGVRTVSIHEANQRRQYLNSSAEAAIASDFRDAMATPFDPEARDAFVGDALRKIDDLAAQNGWDAKIVKAKKQKALGTYYEGVFARMVDLDPSAARAYFKREMKKGMIPGDKVAEIKDMLDKGDLKAFGQQWVDRIFAEHPDDPEARYKALKTIKDPDKRAEAERRLDEETARQERVKKQVREAALEQAKEYIDQGIEVPIALERQLEPADQENLKKYREFKINGPDQVNNEKFSTAADGLRKEDLKDISFTELETTYRPNLDDHHWESLVSRWRIANEKGTARDFEKTSFDEILKKQLIDASLIPDAKKEADWTEQERRTWRNVRDKALDILDAKRGKEDITREVIKQAVNEAMQPTVKIPGSGFNPFSEDVSLPYVAVSRDDQGEVYMDVEVGEKFVPARAGHGRKLVPDVRKIKLSEAGADLPVIEAMATSAGGENSLERRAIGIYIKQELEKIAPMATKRTGLDYSLEEWMKRVREKYESEGREPTLAQYRAEMENLKRVLNGKQ